MATGHSFPQLFQGYYAIHETLHVILSEGGNSQSLTPSDVTKRLREMHPEIQWWPAMLAAAIKQAMRDTLGHSQRRPGARESGEKRPPATQTATQTA